MAYEGCSWQLKEITAMVYWMTGLGMLAATP